MILNIEQVQLEMARQILRTDDLVKLSGLSSYGLNKILKGKTKPTPASIGKIAKALQIDVEEIIKNEK